jgi:hypothetical protein
MVYRFIYPQLSAEKVTSILGRNSTRKPVGLISIISDELRKISQLSPVKTLTKFFELAVSVPSTEVGGDLANLASNYLVEDISGGLGQSRLEPIILALLIPYAS